MVCRNKEKGRKSLLKRQMYQSQFDWKHKARIQYLDHNWHSWALLTGNLAVEKR